MEKQKLGHIEIEKRRHWILVLAILFLFIGWCKYKTFLFLSKFNAPILLNFIGFASSMIFSLLGLVLFVVYLNYLKTIKIKVRK